MEKLLGIIAKIVKAIGAVGVSLKSERAAEARLHKIARAAQERHDELTKAATKARKAGKLKRAKRLDKRAYRKKQRSLKASAKAQARIGEIKELVARKHDLKTRKEDLEAEVAKLRSENKVTIKGDTATGGTKRQRLKTVALASAAACAAGHRANFYSQAGSWSVGQAISGEHYGQRSDCSQWVTTIFKACGLPDPNGQRYGGGYTGTLGAHGKEISRADLKPGDLILYGSYPHHHVELYIGDGQTVGHGSPPIDKGIIDLLSGPKTYRTYV